MKRRIMLAVAASVVALIPVVAQAANKLIVKDSAGTNDKFVVTDNGYIGAGTNAPAVHVHAKGTGVAQLRAQTNMASASAGGSFVMMHNNGSTTALPVAGDRIGAMYFGTEAINPANQQPAAYYGAGVTIRADGPWKFDTVNPALLLAPSYISIDTGSTTAGRVERMKIASTGNVGIGSFGGANPTQRLEVKGGVKISSTGTKPTCDATVRGTFWVSQSATTDPDTVEVCSKDIGTVYSWKALY